METWDSAVTYAFNCASPTGQFKTSFFIYRMKYQILAIFIIPQVMLL